MQHRVCQRAILSLFQRINHFIDEFARNFDKIKKHINVTWCDDVHHYKIPQELSSPSRLIGGCATKMNMTSIFTKSTYYPHPLDLSRYTNCELW